MLIMSHRFGTVGSLADKAKHISFLTGESVAFMFNGVSVIIRNIGISTEIIVEETLEAVKNNQKEIIF